MKPRSASGRPSVSGSGRPSISAPLRVQPGNGVAASSQKGRKTSTSSIKGKSRSLGGPQNSSIGNFGFGASAFVPKNNGRPSSGIGVRGRTDVPSDPRPIKDKKYINQCIRQLFEFAIRKNYPISQKLLVSPSSKDFFKIFAFMFGQLKPGYKMAAKMEEEVPRVLRMLGYPFSISKQYLYSVGSPHTWPHLLAAIMWMMEIVQSTLRVHPEGGIDAFIFGPRSAEDFDKKSDDHICFNYLERTYEEFLNGKDVFQELDEELASTLRQAYQGEDTESVEKDIERLENELDRVAQEEAYLQTLKENVSDINSDEQVLNKFLCDMEECTKQLQAKCDESDEYLKMKASELSAEEAHMEDLRLAYQSQELTQGDVARLKSEQARLKNQVAAVEKQVEDIEADNWSVNIEQSNLNNELENFVASYNRLAIKLKLVPESAEFANGEDYRLKDIETTFEHKIKPQIQVLKIKIDDNIWRKNRDKFQRQCELEKIEERVNDDTERLAKKEKELRKIEEEIDTMKKTFNLEKKFWSRELETEQQDIHQLDNEMAALEKEQTAAASKYNETKNLLDETLDAARKELMVFDEVSKKMKASFESYKENVQVMMAQVKKTLQDDIDKEQQDIDRIHKESEKRDAWLNETVSKISHM